jgi:hypothetical protein
MYLYACIYVCMYVCVCVCMYVCVCMCSLSPSLSLSHTPHTLTKSSHIFPLSHTNTHMYTHTYIYTYILHKLWFNPPTSLSLTNTHTHIDTYIYTHRHIHTYIHTYINTCIHILRTTSHTTFEAMQVIDLVQQRKVFLKRGDAYVLSRDLVSVVLTAFRARLSRRSSCAW